MKVHIKGAEFVVQWRNLFHLRFWISVVMLPTFVIVLLMMLVMALPGTVENTVVFGYFMVVLLIVGMVAVFVTGLLFGTELACPACGKRIKAGFDVCHHCGYQTEHTQDDVFWRRDQ